MPRRRWLSHTLGSYKIRSLARTDIRGTDPPGEVIRWVSLYVVMDITHPEIPEEWCLDQLVQLLE